MKKTYNGIKQEIIELGRAADIITSSGCEFNITSANMSFGSCIISSWLDPNDWLTDCDKYSCDSIEPCDWGKAVDEAGSCYEFHCGGFGFCP